MESQENTDIEEGRGAYRAGGFHPVYIGDIFNSHYIICNKLGYGVYSTVWLARDLWRQSGHEHQYVALKVLSGDCYYTDKDIFEREILRHLRDGDSTKLGYPFICHLLNDFEIEGLNGSFPGWFDNGTLPYFTTRRFAIELALALDYAHERGVIHTDIQPNNIFLRIRDRTLLEGYFHDETPPHQNRDAPYTPIPSRSVRRYYFKRDTESESGTVDGFSVVLGDWGVASWKNKHLTENIQPVALRAPEVLLKAPWDEAVDWWSLGAVVLEAYRALRMFTGLVMLSADDPGHYDVRKHLAEMTDFFGPIPRALLDRGDVDFVKDTFTEDGVVIAFPPNYRDLASENILQGMKREAREEFASFLRLLMKLDPKERPDVMQVLRHPWLDAILN